MLYTKCHEWQCANLISWSTWTCTAETIMESIKTMLSLYDLSMERTVALGSDGAAVMVEKNNSPVSRHTCIRHTCWQFLFQNLRKQKKKWSASKGTLKTLCTWYDNCTTLPIFQLPYKIWPMMMGILFFAGPFKKYGRGFNLEKITTTTDMTNLSSWLNIIVLKQQQQQHCENGKFFALSWTSVGYKIPIIS